MSQLRRRRGTVKGRQPIDEAIACRCPMAARRSDAISTTHERHVRRWTARLNSPLMALTSSEPLSRSFWWRACTASLSREILRQISV